MASGRRSARPRPTRRGGGGDTDGSLEPVQPRIPWTRRIGIVIALLALGGTVVLAGGLGGRGTPGASSSPARSGNPTLTPRPTKAVAGKTPAVAPVLAKPASSVTAKPTWSTRVTLAPTGIPRRDLRLRIYRGDKQVVEVAVRRGQSMPVRDIPLKSGSNVITAVFVAPGGEGPRSKAVTITLDDVGPSLSLSQPQNHDIVNAPSVTLIGTSEAGSTVAVRNLTDPRTQSGDADDDGLFTLVIGLAPGANDLEVSAADALGNVSRVELTVTRGSGAANVELTLSRTTFRVHQLPATFDVNLLVMDADGLPVEGAAVTFSLSPPGVPTSTYFATTTTGHAAWLGATLPDGVQAGDGFVTARVTLESGSTLQETVPFTVR